MVPYRVTHLPPSFCGYLGLLRPGRKTSTCKQVRRESQQDRKCTLHSEDTSVPTALTILPYPLQSYPHFPRAVCNADKLSPNVITRHQAHHQPSRTLQLTPLWFLSSSPPVLTLYCVSTAWLKCRLLEQHLKQCIFERGS